MKENMPICRRLLRERAGRRAFGYDLVDSNKNAMSKHIPWVVALLTAVACAQTNDVIVERDVKVAMRDGVILHADIYRPKQDGKFPVLLQRTPYDKRGDVSFGYKAALKGYV